MNSAQNYDQICAFLNLDDGTLGVNRSEVLQDLEVVNLEGRELGLQLNHQKSEVIRGHQQ